MALSHSPYLRVIAGLFNCITFGYGIAYLFYPLSAVQIFEFDRVPTLEEQYMFNTVLAVTAAKVFFITFAIGTAIFFASSKYLGGLEVASGIMAVIDGFAVKRYVGHGEWNHWGYSWLLALNGFMLLGVFDPVADWIFGNRQHKKLQ